jgi:signal transduction histidine kinase
MPQKEPVALRDLIDEVAQSVLGPSPRIVLDNRIDAALAADADREQLFRVILNLVRNATEALAARETDAVIAVSAARVERCVQIDVADNGPGVPKSVLGKLFVPFASAGRAGGTGLGLAIARDLARSHGGELSLVSTGPDGAVFRVTLPDRS